MNLETLSLQTLQSATKAVKRRSFFRSYLLVLWPNAEGQLLEMARRLGGEVLVPGSTTPLLPAALEAGIKKFDFHRKRDGYDPRTWVANVYLHFWQGTMEAAALAMGFRGHADGAVWNPAHQPFLDWRLEHPGELVWEHRSEVRTAADAERLYRLLVGRKGPRPWVVKEVMRRLANG